MRVNAICWCARTSVHGVSRMPVQGDSCRQYVVCSLHYCIRWMRLFCCRWNKCLAPPSPASTLVRSLHVVLRIPTICFGVELYTCIISFCKAAAWWIFFLGCSLDECGLFLEEKSCQVSSGQWSRRQYAGIWFQNIRPSMLGPHNDLGTAY
jgi:hypothetical protein